MAPIHTNRRGTPSPAISQLETKFPFSPLSLAPSDCGTSQDDQDESRLQECWDENIAKNLNLPEGYRDVQVLMIKWADDIDELKTREEVNELAGVFTDRFQYGVTKVELGISKSQLQLRSDISNWLLKYDSKETLLIVYYAGHGIYVEAKKDLILSPTADRQNSPNVLWRQAENLLLQDVQADVLAIMDCCYASDLARNVLEDGRTFVLLAASGIGLTTPSPGQYSFTRCLIDHLERLLIDSKDGEFTTWDLLEAMQKQRGGDNAPAIWRRLPTRRHIHLRELKQSQDRPGTKFPFPSHAGFLRLGFALKNDDFSTEHIEALTKKLPCLFRDESVPAVDIKFLGYHRVGRRTFRDIADYVKNHHAEVAALAASLERKRSAEQAGFD